MTTHHARAPHESRATQRPDARAIPTASPTDPGAAADRRVRRIRAGLFGLIAVAVLGVGLYLAGGVFLGQRDQTTVANALPVRLSMAGFSPKVITAKAGASVNLDFWNTDSAMHLGARGVHTFIMDEQRIYVEIPAEGRRAFAFTAPMAPGDYDFYCNTCCGGKASPSMHGTLRVEA